MQGSREEIQEKKQEKKEDKQEKRKAGKENQAGLIAICLGIAGIVFLILLNMEKNLLENYEKQEVVTVYQTLPEGQILDGKNVQNYLKLQEVEKAAVPEGALGSLEEAYGHLPAVTLEAGTILSQSLLTDKKEQLDRLEHPVVAGLRADEISQMVCGTLRPGDIIHIYVTDKDTGETQKVWEDVFVEQAFDGNGGKIAASDTEASAQVVNVLLNKADIAYFYTELAKGTLRVVREY